MSYADARWSLEEIANRRVPDPRRLTAAVEALEEGIRKGADEPAWCQAATELPVLAADADAIRRDFFVRRRAGQLAEEFGRLIDIWETDV
jgi:hypothetical protein